MACETLFNLIRNGSLIDGDARVAYLNALYHSDMAHIDCAELYTQQVFKPFVDVLDRAGYNSRADFPTRDGAYDVVLLLLPKNIVEAEYYIAMSLQMLKAGGVIMCAADNKAGGSRLKKMFARFGLAELDHESRNKARVVYGRVDCFDQEYVVRCIQNGGVQSILDERFVSQPGVFGWNKVDKGSEILTRYIPKDLKGKGADFGCGYGYLSHYVLSHCPKVKRLAALDADYRGVEACRQNLSFDERAQDFIWADLTSPYPDLRNLDFVIMNPPFHEGKKADNAIGQGFIKSAHAALKRGGRLWMVANNHLPYERVLEDVFFDFTKHHEGDGFKVYEALR